MSVVEGLARGEHIGRNRCPICEDSLEPTMETGIILDSVKRLPQIAARDTCPICRDLLAAQPETPKASALCSHIFHEECIRKWASRVSVN